MKIFATIVIAIAAIIGLALLFAYPTMWLVNYLFSPQFLYSVFGVTSFSIWKAWALNAFLGSYRSYSSSKSE